MSKRDEMEERCLEVKELQVLGMKVPHIAQMYSVTERSIWNYLRRARELFSRTARNLNHDEILGETVKILERIRTKAMRHFHLCEENTAVKVGYLNTALKATEKLVQLYQEVGVLVKVPERLAVEEGLPFEDPEIRKEYLALLKKARAKGKKIWDCDFKTAMSPSSYGRMDVRENLRLVEHYRSHGFKDPEELLDFIEVFWGIRIPRVMVCPHHTPPAEYLAAAFLEEVQDCVCWANRSGGKTLNGALLTWLDSVFKAGCETKILGGSGEQSLRMYEHIKGFLTPPFQHLVEGEALRTRTHLVNGSNIQILTASSKSVRGPHPQKLKLDEVDEMAPELYEAALLIPKSARGIRASVQIYSTMHKAYGLMNRVITEAAESGYRVYKWCIFCVMERCIGRDCDTCELWEYCEGRARNADGFYPVEDAISAKRKVSRETWESEMLCRMPSQEGLIYKEFDLSVHVV